MEQTKITLINSVETKDLRNTFNLLCRFGTEIISIAISNGVNSVTHYIEQMVTRALRLSNEEIDKEDVKFMQHIVLSIIKDIITSLAPEEWGENSYNFWDGEEAKNILLSICNKESVVVPLVEELTGYQSLIVDVWNFKFTLTKETRTDFLSGEIEDNRKIVKETVEVPVEKPYTVNLYDWYYLYGGKKQLLDLISENNQDLFISSSGDVFTNNIEGFKVYSFVGWDFTSDTLDELINILEADGITALFDDTQQYVMIERSEC